MTSTSIEALSLDDAETTQFVHEPLNLEDKSIRLVRIHPMGPDDIIRCSMKHTNPAEWIANHPTGFRWPAQEEPYTCLSYVWGTDDPTHEILINDKRMQVRDNLFECMRNVARKATPSAPYNGREGYDPKNPVMWTDRDEFHRWWWIDALCIDQSNATEKNHQVQRMGNIYFDSESVVAWIGNEPDIASLFQRVKDHNYPITPETIESGIEQLKTSIYWTRAWIVQETRLSQTVFLLAQDVLVEASDIRYHSSELFVSSRTSGLEQLLEGICDAGLPTATLMGGFVGRHMATNLIQRIWQFRNKQCYDRRDIVYSVLSLAGPDTIVTVDYNRTFAELAKAVLKANDYPNARRDGVGACLCQAYLVTQSLQLNQDRENSEHDIPMIEIQGLHVDLGEEKPQEQLVRCRQCSETLDLASVGKAGQWRGESVFVFCLSCNHETENVPDDDSNNESDKEPEDESEEEPGKESEKGFGEEPDMESDNTPDDKTEDESDDESDDGPDDDTHHTVLGHLILISRSDTSLRDDELYWLPPRESQDKERSVEIRGYQSRHSENDDSTFLKLSVKAVCQLLDLVDVGYSHFTADKIARIVQDEFKRNLVVDWKVVE